MPIYSILAVYFIIWWLVLFMVLPFGVRTHAEEGDVVLGTTASAPANLNLIRKMIITSIISAVIVYGIWYGYVKMGWTAESLARFGM
jgi:predicted secreted protein